MSGEFLTRLDRSMIAEAARRSRGGGAVEIGDWRVQRLAYVATSASSDGIFRVAGNGREGARPLGWSLILKAVRAPHGRDPKRYPAGKCEGPEDYSYWKREVLAYQSGLLAELPSGLAAPRCFGVVEQPGDAYWLWLEDLGDAGTAAWPLDGYRVVARHLGRFNGAYLTGRPLPSYPWLSRGWLRAWLTHIDGSIVQPAMKLAADPAVWKHPVVRQTFADTVAERLQSLCGEPERLLDALERLPQTFCHLDAYRPNLFSGRNAEQTLAIDWAFAGTASAGEEIAQLVAGSLFFKQAPPSQARRLDEAVFDGYWEGLQAAGWKGDRRLVRFGYSAAAALRWGFHISHFLRLAVNDKQRAQVEQQAGRPIQTVLKDWAAVFDFLLDLAGEAWALLKSLRA